MSNHSDMPGDSPLPNELRKVLANELRKVLESAEHEPLIGATGLHPSGKMTPHDEGGIQFAVGVRDAKVVIDFGTPVKWLGMDPSDALELAETLIQNARKAAKGQGSILTLNL